MSLRYPPPAPTFNHPVTPLIVGHDIRCSDLLEMETRGSGTGALLRRSASRRR